jgi:hypothetical protein
MQISDILAQLGGTDAIARELGVSEDQAASGAAALAPAILGGLKKQAQSSGGIEGLGGLLGQLGGGGLLDEVLSSRPTDVAHGNDVLGQIFGSKDVSRTVAQDAAAKTGLDPGLLKKMLPLVAMLLAGFAAKQAGAAARGAPEGGGLGGLGGMLGGILGGGRSPTAPSSPSTTASPSATGGLAAMLDLNGDGNALDDIIGMAGKALRR